MLRWCLVLFGLSATVRGVALEPSRTRRGIFGTVTSTIYKTVEEKHYVPVSCLHVAPNLPECRNVRFMNYPRFNSEAFKIFNIGNDLSPTVPINGSGNVTVISKRVDDVGATIQVQSWGEFLGFYRPTVTITQLKIKPTTVLDSRIVVTYDIRGCRPKELPYNLPKCAEEASADAPQIIPTTTVLSEIVPTKLVENSGSVLGNLFGSEQIDVPQHLQASTEIL